MSGDNKVLETSKIENEAIRKNVEITIRNACKELREIGYEVYLDDEGGVTVTDANEKDKDG